MRADAIDRTRAQKLYCQLADVLRSRIEAGQWEVGSQIPTEERLALQFDVSKATVRLAIDELVSLGHLKKFQGKGTFVRRRRPEHGLPLLTDLAEEGLRDAPSCMTRLVDYGLRRPPENVRLQLGAGESDNCHVLSSLTVGPSSPWLLRRSFLPYGLLPAALDADEAERAGRSSIYAFVESRCALKIQRLSETIDVSSAGEADGALLELEPGSPVLRARHLCSARGDVPVLFSESLFRTETRPRTLDFERPNT